MIISQSRIIKSSSSEEYAWQGIRRFHNVHHTAQLLKDLHEIPEKQKSNALKQAHQIRYCLSLAEEYKIASKAVSISTRPTLLYYCCMWLALAEILFKQSGKSSLDYARNSHHKHHGMTTNIAGIPDTHDNLEVSSLKLIVKPLEKGDGQRFGTFSLWHKTSREHPIVGRVVTTADGISNHKTAVIFYPEDKPLESIPSNGIELNKLIRSIPSIIETVTSLGLRPSLSNSTFSQNQTNRELETMNVTIQPNHTETLKSLYNKIEIEASSYEQITIRELKSGMIISQKFGKDFPVSGFRLPNAVQIDYREAFLCTDNESLNEFGLYYASLFILGNLSRYYPDIWIKHIEESSPLYIACNSLIESAFERIPILTLSELERCKILMHGVSIVS